MGLLAPRRRGLGHHGGRSQPSPGTVCGASAHTLSAWPLHVAPKLTARGWGAGTRGPPARPARGRGASRTVPSARPRPGATGRCPPFSSPVWVSCRATSWIHFGSSRTPQTPAPATLPVPPRPLSPPPARLAGARFKDDERMRVCSGGQASCCPCGGRRRGRGRGRGCGVGRAASGPASRLLRLQTCVSSSHSSETQAHAPGSSWDANPGFQTPSPALPASPVPLLLPAGRGLLTLPSCRTLTTTEWDNGDAL